MQNTGFEVIRSAECERDLDDLFEFLVSAQISLGESMETALGRAKDRANETDDLISALGHTPFQGTLWPDLMADLRWTTKNRTIVYFLADKMKRQVTVLAIFFGGQDHKRLILKRLRSDH